MLDDAGAPITIATLTEALEPLDQHAGEARFNARDLRARRLLKYFQDSDLVGCIHWSTGIGRNAGWVWSARLLSEEVWRQAAKKPPPEPLAVVRLGRPEAFVTTIGRPSDRDDGRGSDVTKTSPVSHPGKNSP